MVWMPSRCSVCGSDVSGRRCENHDDSGTPCWGMNDEAAALYRAREDFAHDRIDLETMQARIEQALTDPPKRRFSLILTLR